MLRGLRTVLDADTRLTIRAGVNRGPAFCGHWCREPPGVRGDGRYRESRGSAGRSGGAGAAARDGRRPRSLAHEFESEAQPFLMKGKEAAVTAYRVGAITGVREEEPPPPCRSSA